MAKKLTKLIINRKKWLRGEFFDSADAYLLDSKDRMCCLGFHMRQVDGIQKKHLLDNCEPSDCKITSHQKQQKEKYENSILVYEDHCGDMADSTFTNDAIDINDRTDYKNEKNREKDLKKLFRKKDILVKFEN